MKVVVLAGGHGTRLWPMSTKDFPKQFVNIFDNKSLIQNTLDRFLNFVGKEDIYLNTNKKYFDYLKDHLDEYDIDNYILEPAKKDTAPAIAYVVKYLEQFFDENEVIFLSPSDHLITPVSDFRKYMFGAEKIAKEGGIILFGIRPNKPETGYGYIQVNDKSDGGICEVMSFKEKPDFETAQKYLLDGNYYWNSGMFMFSIKTIKNELKKYWDDGDTIDMNFDDFDKNFDDLRPISIDYAVMEKSKNIKLMPMNLIWSDIGSWDSVYDNMTKNKDGNVLKGNIKTDSEKSMIICDSGREVIVSGVDDIILIENEYGICLTKKGYSQGIKKFL